MSFKTPTNLQYLASHEWILIEGDIATVGISDYAQDALGDVVYVDLPDVGTTFAAGAEFGVAESVKASSELYLPAAGEVIAVNGDVSEQTDLINSDPYGKGWLVRIKLSGDKADLLDAAAYVALVDSIKH
ncbi:MAG: glycine cleavage system protein GcvH [Chloroflexia bacterium]|nr:glycine cleavage system protein GcvH [Chloroflexia bacterium]